MQRLLQLGIELRISYAFCSAKTFTFSLSRTHEFTVFFYIVRENLNVHARYGCHFN